MGQRQTVSGFPLPRRTLPSADDVGEHAEQPAQGAEAARPHRVRAPGGLFRLRRHLSRQNSRHAVYGNPAACRWRQGHAPTPSLRP